MMNNKTKIDKKSNSENRIKEDGIKSEQNFFGKLFDADENSVKWLMLVLMLVFLIAFAMYSRVFADDISKKVDNIKLVKIKNNHNKILAEKIEKLTAGYPIEKMTRYLSYENKEVAAFMVAIAKKESNWGKRTPKYRGKECYNYWGFRAKRAKMGTGGHTCFDSPKDAVRTVSKRIEDLLAKGVNTPQKMVVWKCGYSCGGHNPQSVRKWISDVSYYYNKF